MKNYLYIIHKSMEHSNTENVEQIINEVKDCKHDYVSYNSDNIQCYYYTNENISLNPKKGDYFFAFSGQLANTFEYIENGIKVAGLNNEKLFISSLAGANSVSFAHFPTNTIKAYNSFSGVNPVFYCETDNRIVVGLDPLVVNCVAFERTSPIFDLEGVVPFLMQGYFMSNDTIFKSVKLLPHNKELKIQNSKMEITDIDNSLDNLFQVTPTQNDYEELADSYLKAFNVVPKSESPYSVGLTGGKDSRLIVLGMLHSKLPFKTVTRGDEDNPDVIVGKMLASKLNLDHEVKQMSNANPTELKIDLTEKILKTMLGTSGELYGYEKLNYITEYKGKIGITGVGAEGIRGGFALTRNKETTNIGDQLSSFFYPLKDMIVKDKRDIFELSLRNFGQNFSSIRKAGNELFITYYNGRKTAGARAGLSYYSQVLSPFYDNNFLKKATQFNIDEITSEKVHYNLMKMFDPEISMMPFANSRWEFEKRGPLDPNDFNGWMNRQPIIAKSKRGSYNWRSFKNKDSVLKESFKSILFNEPNSEIFDIVDYEKLRTLFNKPIPGAYNKFLWSLLSVKVFMDHFNQSGKSNNYSIVLELPKPTEINVNQNEIYNIFHTLKSQNDKLKVYDVGTEKEIVVNQESEKYGYLITGGGNLTTPPKDDNKFLIENFRKSFSVRFCIDVLQENLEISLYVMFFKESKRVSSKEYKIDISKGINYLSRTLNVVSNSDYIKFAIKVKSQSTDPVFRIKYGYLKYN